MLKKMLLVLFALLLLVSIFFNIQMYIKYSNNCIDVCVASHQINQRSKITEDDLLMIKLPKQYINDDVCIDSKDIVDKYVKLSYSIPKGSMIYSTSLETDIKDLANTLLMKDEVNYDIYTNEIRVNTANLNRNMYVDMYLTINNKEKPISDLLIGNARITGMYDNNNKLILDYDSTSKVYIISLAIKKEYVNILNKAKVIGDISIVVNNSVYNANDFSYLNIDSGLFEYLE